MSLPQKVAILKSSIGKHGGGLEKYARRLIEAFVADHHHVTVLTISSEPLPTMPNCEMINLAKPSQLGIANVWQFNRLCHRWLRENPQDVVFGMDRTTCHTHYRAGNGVHAAYLERRKKTEGWFKSMSFAINPLHQLILNYEQRAFEDEGLHRLFTNSQMVKNEVLSHYTLNPNKIAVIHNGVEWHEWQAPFDAWINERPQLLQRHGLNPDKFQLLFVGHGFRRKGLHLLLEGLAALNRRDIELSVVGKDKNLSHFQNLANELGITSQVHFCGIQKEVIPFYQMADALAIPSTYDPFANVTLEALAMGVPVISSRDNGAHEILSPSLGQIIDDTENCEAFAHTLSAALQWPKTMEQANTIRHAAQKFDFSSQIRSIVDNTIYA